MLPKQLSPLPFRASCAVALDADRLMAHSALHVTTVAAREALDELTSAGIYRTAKIDKGKTVSYLAEQVL